MTAKPPNISGRALGAHLHRLTESHAKAHRAIAEQTASTIRAAIEAQHSPAPAEPDPQQETAGVEADTPGA